MKIKQKPVKKNLTYAFVPMFAYVGIELLMIVVYLLLMAFPKLAKEVSSGNILSMDMASEVLAQILASDSMLMLLMVNVGVLAYALYSFMRSESFAYDRRYKNRIYPSDILKMAVVSLGLYFSVNIVLTVLVQISRQLGMSMDELNQSVSGMVDMNVFFALFIVVIVGPVMEELLVRGLIFNRFRAIGSPAFAIGMSSLIFASMHFPVIVQCIYTFAVGAVFAWAYYKYENILIPIILHIFYNMCSFIFMIEPINMFFSTFGGIVVFYFLGVALTALGIKFIRNKVRPEMKEEYMEVALNEQNDAEDSDYMM